MTRLDRAMLEAGEDQVREACRTLRLDPEEAAFVLAMYRRTPSRLDLVLVIGGGLGDYVRQLRECYAVESGGWTGGLLRP